jgi:hypothetical protein
MFIYLCKASIFFQTPSSTTINSIATYTFYLSDSAFTSTSTFTGILRIIFPNGLYSFGSTTPCFESTTQSPYTCNVTNNSTISFNYPGTVRR